MDKALNASIFNFYSRTFERFSHKNGKIVNFLQISVMNIAIYLIYNGKNILKIIS